MYASSVNEGERTVDDSTDKCESESGLLGRAVEATMRTIGASERRYQSGKGVGQPGEEEVVVEPFVVITPVTPEPHGYR
jgi:hypothetical protein